MLLAAADLCTPMQPIFSKLCMHMSSPRNLSFSQKFKGVQIYACHVVSVR